MVNAAGNRLDGRGFESQSSHIFSLFSQKMWQKLSKFVSILAIRHQENVYTLGIVNFFPSFSSFFYEENNLHT